MAKRRPRWLMNRKQDHETAQSAVRNLNNQEIGGRPLRIDLADSDPFLEGKTTIRGELVDASETRAQWRERERERGRGDDREFGGGGRGHHGGGRGGGGSRNDPHAFLAKLPRGVLVPPGSTPMDTISNVLARENPSQILEVLAQMKAFVITHPEHAKALLVAHPQLGYALFQALLLNKIVDPTILSRMLAATNMGSAPPAAAPPPPAAPMGYPPLPSAMHHPQPGYMPPPHMAGPSAVGTPPNSMYGGPPPPQNPHMPPPAQLPPYYARPPPPQAMPPPQQAMPPPQQPPQQQQQQQPPMGAGFGAQHSEVLAQVLSLTQEQINTLPPNDREQIIALRKQLGLPS
ncbi:hypothetical protein EIP91_007308 [Steccherinum ochraceum]|uniref:Cleavage stimulation factor subunit 2 hinge domain-containing protein n=1 Tax=Steccherinum ochraceum TaxID=92696 RepID=A0A4R0R6Z1_9APHY|nr:hypothetical protein EIP91_007308 [Steccherinum ochraceum]